MNSSLPTSSLAISGIHHITAIASNAQATVDFYTQVLGLRLVKKTVNQDDVSAYHLYFGDQLGSPGMDLTFFIFQPVMEGVKGVGQVTQVAFAVPPGSLKFWSKRLQRLQVEQFHSTEIFGKPAVEFRDPDDLGLLLIEETESDLSFHSPHSVWITDQVGAEVAIQHFYSATLAAESMELLQPLLENGLGYHFQTAQQQLHRFTLSGQHKAADLIIEKAPDLEPGFGGAGTVHHIAFRVRDQQHQLALRSLMSDYGLHPTQVIDRFYFHSVYFRTPAGILFELATDAPGFTVDEPVETLGEKLSLPPFLESYRSTIEAGLTPLK